MIPLSRSLVGKFRGYDIDFLRCSFRLFPFQPLDGEMPSPKIGSLTGFSERFIRPEPSSAATRITNHDQFVAKGQVTAITTDVAVAKTREWPMFRTVR